MVKKLKKLAKSEEKFRLVLKTKDGSLIVNREAQKDFYTEKHEIYNGMVFAEHSLRIDAREHGVKLISWSMTDEAVVGIVEYLK